MPETPNAAVPGDTPAPAPAAPAPPTPGASRTAVGVALMRALHRVVDAPPPILDDPVAAALVGADVLARAAADPARLRAPGPAAVRAHVVTRGRFAEDRLRAAAARGVAQYVVLGAGLDTFAYRRPAWAAGVRVLEVDHPASQRDKRARLAAAGVAEPGHVAYAALDLEAVVAAAPDGADVGGAPPPRPDALLDALAGHGLRRDAPAFVAWLGVAMYLSADAVAATFRALARLPRGSEVAFTFAPPPPPGVAPGDWPSPAHRAATAGEPWRAFHTPAELEALLGACGYAGVHFLTPDEAAARYFRGRADGLPAPRDVTVAAATV